MAGLSIIIADKTVLFALEIEQILRSNGFEDLSVESIQTQKGLMREFSKRETDVLIMGDLYENEGRKNDFALDSFLSSTLKEKPDILVISVSKSQLSEDLQRKRNMFSFDKPVDVRDIFDLVTEWNRHRDTESLSA